MTDKQLFDDACFQIVLTGERGPDGTLTINGWEVAGWPKSIKVRGRWFFLGEVEGDRELTGTTPRNKNEPEQVRAFYDAVGD